MRNQTRTIIFFNPRKYSVINGKPVLNISKNEILSVFDTITKNDKLKMITYFCEFTDGQVVVIEAKNKAEATEKAKEYENKHGEIKDIQ